MLKGAVSGELAIACRIASGTLPIYVRISLRKTIVPRSLAIPVAASRVCARIFSERPDYNYRSKLHAERRLPVPLLFGDSIRVGQPTRGSRLLFSRKCVDSRRALGEENRRNRFSRLHPLVWRAENNGTLFGRISRIGRRAGVQVGQPRGGRGQVRRFRCIIVPRSQQIITERV